MTIRRGEPWGSEIDRPVDLLVADGDAALAEAITRSETRPLGVSAGDLHRAVGRPAPRARVQALPIDVLDVTLDDVGHVAVAHVVARRSWWRGAVVAVCNVDHVGDWNVAPRAHPNDGRFDVVEVDPAMTIRQRAQARHRLPAGTHVPHPRITTRTSTDASWTFDHPVAVWIDGRRTGVTTKLTVVVRPDAAVIHV